MTHYEKMLEDALGAYQRQRDHYDETRREIENATSTATSARREVTATVGRTGELTELSFPTSAYKRMAPAELASVIVQTISAARQQSMAAAAELMAPMLPPGISAADLMSGKADVHTLFSARVPGFEEGNLP
ncbi:YbaB/EbfC family nucleoid-associated protein [Amycolatopsis benzoatilytica]|uniref:YbaB/EbfC family nucleoid-associated protein n=1 Tax=Amycolatopsis benzoatilytica TaxID=346045 RepID=UPI0003717F70|nr:YbaB/EbfC family nucleoid-associated protein [Amycolatopsis benzoatilytica]